MKIFRLTVSRALGFLLLALSLILLNGCATADPDNASARPWNSPKSWEGGMPSSVFEGR